MELAGYDNLDDAAAEALYRISKLPKAQRDEYISIVYQDPETGRYVATTPQTQGDIKKASGKFQVPKGSARAIVHNHPGKRRMGSSPQYFTDTDITTAERSGLISYIDDRSVPAGEVRRYDPANPSEKQPMVGDIGESTSALSRGEPVLARIPIEAMREQHPPKVLDNARVAAAEAPSSIDAARERRIAEFQASGTGL